MNATQRAQQQTHWIAGIDPLAERFQPFGEHFHCRADEHFERFTREQERLTRLARFERQANPPGLPDFDDHMQKIHKGLLQELPQLWQRSFETVTPNPST